MPKYPQLDLPTLDGDIELRLQARQFLEQAHDMSEDSSYFYPVAHKAVQLAAQASFDTPQFIVSADLGVGIFEALGYFVAPDAHYDSEAAKALTYTSAMQFIESIKSSDDFLTVCDYAMARMETDAPNLTAAVQEIAGRYTGHDDIATKFAVRGASAVRGMQIFVDKRLEAAA